MVGLHGRGRRLAAVAAGAVLLAGGTALFVAADTAFLRLLAIAHSPVRAVAAGAALATIPLGLAVAAAAQVAALAAIVALGAAARSGPSDA